MVSVCMATHNGALYIKEQIQSILSQLTPEDELVISDDGSSDNTLEIIRSFNDTRIRLFHYEQKKIDGNLKRFKYATRNFNNALSQAKGDYIFLSDQDDIWIPGKIKIMLPYLQKYDCVHHGRYDLYQGSGGIIVQEPRPNHKNIITALTRMKFTGCCMGITRRLLDRALPIPESIVNHDGWIGCLAMALYSYHYIPEPLLKHRIHNANLSEDPIRKNSLYTRLSYRFHILSNLMKRSVRP